MRRLEANDERLGEFALAALERGVDGVGARADRARRRAEAADGGDDVGGAASDEGEVVADDEEERVAAGARFCAQRDTGAGPPPSSRSHCSVERLPSLVAREAPLLPLVDRAATAAAAAAAPSSLGSSSDLLGTGRAAPT